MKNISFIGNLIITFIFPDYCFFLNFGIFSTNVQFHILEKGFQRLGQNLAEIKSVEKFALFF